MTKSGIPSNGYRFTAQGWSAINHAFTQASPRWTKARLIVLAGLSRNTVYGLLERPSEGKAFSKFAIDTLCKTLGYTLVQGDVLHIPGNRDYCDLLDVSEIAVDAGPKRNRTDSQSTGSRKATFSELCEQYQDVLTPYLEWLIRTNSTLDPRGLGKDLKSGALELDRVYVSLAVERQARLGWKDDLLERMREPVETEELLQAAETHTDREEGERQQEELLRRKMAAAEQIRPVSPAEALRQQTRTVIVGKPGCGKTTLLRYLARHFAEACKEKLEHVIVRETEDFGETRLPILLRIAHYADASPGKRALGLRDYLPKAFSDTGVSEDRLDACFKAFMQADYCLLLLDGLDEVTNFNVRGQIAERIDSLAAGCSSNNIVVTSRITGYRAYPLGAEFTEYKLLDMTPEQITEFLSRYCPIYERALKEKATDAEIEVQATANRTAIEAALKKNIGVRRLATNPLLLAILTVIQSMRKRLPHNRVELYKHTVEIVLMDHPMHRGLSEQETIGDEEALPLFGPMALWLHKERSSGMALEREVRTKFADALSQELSKGL